MIKSRGLWPLLRCWGPHWTHKGGGRRCGFRFRSLHSAEGLSGVPWLTGIETGTPITLFKPKTHAWRHTVFNYFSWITNLHNHLSSVRGRFGTKSRSIPGWVIRGPCCARDQMQPPAWKARAWAPGHLSGQHHHQSLTTALGSYELLLQSFGPYDNMAIVWCVCSNASPRVGAKEMYLEGLEQ